MEVTTAPKLWIPKSPQLPPLLTVTSSWNSFC